jgi:hypothetical protein
MVEKAVESDAQPRSPEARERRPRPVVLLQEKGIYRAELPAEG